MSDLITQAKVSGNMSDVRDLARVVDPLPSVGTLIPEHYAGYITVNESTNGNIFFWFFPASTSYFPDPTDAPTVMWLQGGPGSSSMFGLLEIHGPILAYYEPTCTKDDINDKTCPTLAEVNHYSWNREANMIYVDQPVGTGYSHVDPIGLPTTEDDVSRELHEFLMQFFELFDNYANTPFYPFGESYAGKFVPSISRKIIEENLAGPRVPINIQGLGVGDGFINPVDTAVHAEQLYGVSLIDEKTYADLKDIEDQIKTAAANNQWTLAHNVSVESRYQIIQK